MNEPGTSTVACYADLDLAESVHARSMRYSKSKVPRNGDIMFMTAKNNTAFDKCPSNRSYQVLEFVF